MKVWITKYALTAGIIETGVAEEVGDGMIRANIDMASYCFHGEGQEWHKTKESALRRAEIMKANKLDSLRTQIAKVEAINFQSPGD